MASTIISRTQGLVGDFGIKAPVKVATTAAVNLSGLQTIDAVALVEFDDVLVKSQSDATQNGIYRVHPTAWERRADFDGPGDVAKGTLVFVTDGSTNGGSLFELTTANPVNIGGDSASNITFAVLAVGGGTGDVNGPSSAVDGHFAVFDTTTGKLIKDGGAKAAIASSGSASDLTSGSVALARLGLLAAIAASGSASDLSAGTVPSARLANAALLAAANAFTKSQSGPSAALSDGSSIDWDLEVNQIATLTLGGDHTLANPTNMRVGTFILIVDMSGHALTFEAAFLWPDATPPTLSGKCVLSFVCDGTHMLGNGLKAFA